MPITQREQRPSGTSSHVGDDEPGTLHTNGRYGRDSLPQVRGPAVPRRRLGAELRRLRDEAGLRIEQVAAELECSTSKISRLETGKGIPKIRDVRDMLALYQMTDRDLQERLLSLAREGQQQGWWEEYSDILQADEPVSAHLDTYIALEADASTLLSFDPTLVHGLLQTERYARSIFEALPLKYSGRKLDRLVELRLHRQQVLTRAERPLELRHVLDEAVLWRPIGGRQVMCDQLRKLLQEAERPNITIQVLPFEAGIHSAINGMIEILQFPDAADHDVVCFESLAYNVYLESDSDVAKYRQAFEDVAQKALNPTQSADLIEAALARHGKLDEET